MRFRGEQDMRSTYRAGGGVNNSAETTMNLMEMENNRRIGMLGDQVSQLRQISIDINGEVESQNALLEGMDSQFGSTQDLLSNTMRKLDTMLKKGSKKHMLLLIGFVVFVFIVIYFGMSRS